MIWSTSSSRSRRRLGALALALALAGLSGSAEAYADAVVPPFEFGVRDVEGRVVRLDALRGQVVLVDVWATWCKPCRQSLPFYATLLERHRAQGFVVVAVSVDKSLDVLRAFVRERKLPFTILHDPEGKVPAAIGLEDMPTLVLLGRDGQAVMKHAGFVRSDRARIEAAVRAALGTPPPSPPR